jgi:flagellar biosynthesis chaperone FliJ
MIDWNKRNGGFLAPESVYEDQLSNLSMQINQLEKQLNKQKEVLDKIKEDLIKTKKYNKVNDNNYINIDLDHLNYLLKILEGIE